MRTPLRCQDVPGDNARIVKKTAVPKRTMRIDHGGFVLHVAAMDDPFLSCPF